MKTELRIAAFAIALGLATQAGAQIHAPPPALQGQPSYHLWSIPGVVVNGVTTAFSCTNASSAGVSVGIEVFDSSGTPKNDPDATALVLAPGGTATFVGYPTAGLAYHSDLALPLVLGGSARILATAASGVVCSAFLVDPGSAPPTMMTNLTVAKHSTPMMAAVCGLGAELALVLPPLVWLRARRRRV